MGLLECPDCKGKVSEIAPSCPHCGRPFGEGEPTELLFKQKKRELEVQRNKRNANVFAMQEERKKRKQEEERKSIIAKRSKRYSARDVLGIIGKAAGFFVFWTLAVGLGAQSLSGEGGIFLFEHPFAAMLIAIFPAIINYYAVYPRK